MDMIMGGNDYAIRNLVCRSKKKVPEGRAPYNGLSSSHDATQAWCEKGMGHMGDHSAHHYSKESGLHDGQVMTWPNTTGIPLDLIRITKHTLGLLAERYPTWGSLNDGIAVINDAINMEKGDR